MQIKLPRMVEWIIHKGMRQLITHYYSVYYDQILVPCIWKISVKDLERQREGFCGLSKLLIPYLYFLSAMRYLKVCDSVIPQLRSNFPLQELSKLHRILLLRRICVSNSLNVTVRIAKSVRISSIMLRDTNETLPRNSSPTTLISVMTVQVDYEAFYSE